MITENARLERTIEDVLLNDDLPEEKRTRYTESLSAIQQTYPILVERSGIVDNRNNTETDSATFEKAISLINAGDLIKGTSLLSSRLTNEQIKRYASAREALFSGKTQGNSGKTQEKQKTARAITIDDIYGLQDNKDVGAIQYVVSALENNKKFKSSPLLTYAKHVLNTASKDTLDKDFSIQDEFELANDLEDAKIVFNKLATNHRLTIEQYKEATKLMLSFSKEKDKEPAEQSVDKTVDEVIPSLQRVHSKTG
jgi:hypothetical protein